MSRARKLYSASVPRRELISTPLWPDFWNVSVTSPLRAAISFRSGWSPDSDRCEGVMVSGPSMPNCSPSAVVYAAWALIRRTAARIVSSVARSATLQAAVAAWAAAFLVSLSVIAACRDSTASARASISVGAMVNVVVMGPNAEMNWPRNVNFSASVLG